MDVAEEEDTGCIEVVRVREDNVESEVGAKLGLVEVAPKELLLTT